MHSTHLSAYDLRLPCVTAVGDNIADTWTRAVPQAGALLGALAMSLGKILLPQPQKQRQQQFKACWWGNTELSSPPSSFWLGVLNLLLLNDFMAVQKFIFFPPGNMQCPSDLVGSLLPVRCSNMQGTGPAQGCPLCWEVPVRVRLWRTEGTTTTRQKWRDDKVHQLLSEIKGHPRLNQPGQPSCQIIIDGYWNPSNS